MDTEGLTTIESTPDAVPDEVGAALLATHVLSEESSGSTPPSAPAPGSGSPSGWTLVVASVGIALVVLLIMGVGFGIGYLIDLRNGVDSLGIQSNSAPCTTST